MNTIVKMKFGSHLYGTSTPKSDTDFKGIFMPEINDILLGRIPKCLENNTKKNSDAKNTAEDVDSQLYSLHYFIDLACQGETCALDMLCCPDDMCVETSKVWQDIRAFRSKFYTRNLKSFVGYARKQAAKYGVKGSRLSDCKAALDFILSCDQHMRMSDVWDKLPEGEHISMSLSNMGAQCMPMYTVCGRSIQATCKLNKAAEILNKYYESYGARAKLAEQNDSIDWKSVSHALRAAYQVKEILTTGDLIFPLKDAEYLKLVKSQSDPLMCSRILSCKNGVGPQLERLMEEVELLSQKSTLPDSVDRKFWDNFILNAIDEEYRAI